MSGTSTSVCLIQIAAIDKDINQRQRLVQDNLGDLLRSRANGIRGYTDKTRRCGLACGIGLVGGE